MADETIPSNGEPDTKEAKDFVDALNHSAERVQTLWFSFLTFMLYLAIAAGTTTYRMLFLERVIAAQWQATGCASEAAPYVL